MVTQGGEETVLFFFSRFAQGWCSKKVSISETLVLTVKSKGKDTEPALELLIDVTEFS